MRLFPVVLILAFILFPYLPEAGAEGIRFQVRRILNEGETPAATPETFPYSRGPVETEVPVAPEAVLDAADVAYATVPLKKEVWNQLPSGSWKEGPEGTRELLYSEEIKLDFPADPRVEFVLTSTGSKKLEEFTGSNIRNGAAVIGNNQVLSKAVILAPITDGRVKLFHVEENLNTLVKFLNDMGVKLLVRPEDAESKKTQAP